MKTKSLGNGGGGREMQRSSTAHRKEKQDKLTLKLIIHITEIKNS